MKSQWVAAERRGQGKASYNTASHKRRFMLYGDIYAHWHALFSTVLHNVIIYSIYKSLWLEKWMAYSGSRFDLTILKHLWSKEKKLSLLFFYTHSSAVALFFFFLRFRSFPMKRASSSCSRCHKTIFPSVVTPHPYSSSLSLSTSQNHLSTTRTDIVNGPFPRWRFKDVIEPITFNLSFFFFDL